MKKIWTVYVNVNGGEYISRVIITAEKLVKHDDCTVLADGVEIQFDEDIEEILNPT